MYAQELHATAEEQKGRAAFSLAYDSYKLAVSFYLKAHPPLLALCPFLVCP